MTPQLPHIPPELFIDIFHFLYMDEVITRKSKLGDSSHKLLTLMLVCKYFYQIIQSTPAFWTRLWLVRTTRNTQREEAGWIEWIRKHITKSGELPLRVFFILSAPPLTKILPILLPTSPRWVHLTVTPLSVITRLSGDYGTFQQLFDAPIPRLLSLSVGGLGTCMDAVSGIGTVFRHAPKLVELEWRDRFVVFRPDTGASGAVHEYVQYQSLEGATYDFAQNTMEVLHIEGVMIHIPFQCMVMRRLRFLSLGSSCRASFFLERWELPLLEELHISASPYDEVEGLATPSYPALKRIKWLDLQSEPAPADTLSNKFLIIRVLVASSGLQAFYISTRNPNIHAYLNVRSRVEQSVDRISPFLATDDATGAPKYCPNLRELCVQEAGIEELERLADIRSQLEKVEVVALRRDSTSPSLEVNLSRLDRAKERVGVIFQEWVSPFLSQDP
ncbi:hypothetical protein FS837_005972 [Tulasnella sp. UAMH 9824]|nr:hypothetical protein FS837_005972 [Tulasnella sp. UAMH 9824]